MLQVFDNKTVWKKVRRSHELDVHSANAQTGSSGPFDAPHPSEVGGRGQAKNSFVAHKFGNVFENFQHPVVRAADSWGHCAAEPKLWKRLSGMTKSVAEPLQPDGGGYISPKSVHAPGQRHRVGCVAQLVEQLTLNQRVWGSSPHSPTNKFLILIFFFCFFGDPSEGFSSGVCGRGCREIFCVQVLGCEGGQEMDS
jgi:hypothetical protein